MKKFEEKTINSKEIFSGKIVRLLVDDVLLPDGNMAKREIVKHPGAVAIIAINDENKVIMVEQYRKPLERSLLEIPAGKLEYGEEPLVTAERELEEETGYAAGKMEHLISFYTSPGFADELIHLYIATDLTKIDNPKIGDEDEFVELHEITLEEAIHYVEEKRIYDAKTVYAVSYLQLRMALKSNE
ncbi:NUDIX hydrolase [Lederbergia wuyishanensis]|uniref:ADP-ribose pyrophosphatase n=1 Tax=Lederbergia wuyishanensis TaxID=1347903 RepID=A0ABU0D151_9BACI|nr:NUDIX hydrolase [Lederbergia wuyishanensis]MCJ8006739.1 NUDIX hydrolase [Lederbergia wuyishanensis]MDQ0342121.1 ADP-ribose pyrophosphatase [Lederbergia wuyishanensis]